jgi:hypothetical protein
MAADEGVDLLWTTRNAFYVGAHQAAIAEAADLDGLGELDRLERDVFTYRAYVELGSYEVSGCGVCVCPQCVGYLARRPGAGRGGAREEKKGGAPRRRARIDARAAVRVLFYSHSAAVVRAAPILALRAWRTARWMPPVSVCGALSAFPRSGPKTARSPLSCAPRSSISQPSLSLPLPLLSKQIVLNEVGDDAAQPLLAVRLLASLRAGKIEPEAAKAQLAEWTAPGGPGAGDPTTRAVAATLALAAGDPTAALAACHGLADAAPELGALAVQALLALDRPDAAERAARGLAALDDDAALSHLAAAWVGTALGGRRAAEAGTILEELGDRFGWTPRLAAAASAAALRRREWGEAERYAGEALAKDAKCADALANAAVAALHLGKGPVAGRHLAALKAAAPGHPLAVRLAAADEAFDRAAGGVVA